MPTWNESPESAFASWFQRCRPVRKPACRKTLLIAAKLPASKRCSSTQNLSATILKRRLLRPEHVFPQQPFQTYKSDGVSRLKKMPTAYQDARSCDSILLTRPKCSDQVTGTAMNSDTLRYVRKARIAGPVAVIPLRQGLWPAGDPRKREICA